MKNTNKKVFLILRKHQRCEEVGAKKALVSTDDQSSSNYLIQEANLVTSTSTGV